MILLTINIHIPSFKIWFLKGTGVCINGNCRIIWVLVKCYCAVWNNIVRKEIVDLININCVAVHNKFFVVFDIPTLNDTITVMHTKPIVMFLEGIISSRG